MTLDCDDVVRVIGATKPPQMHGLSISGWSIDSRTLAPGDLFFALRGPDHDGHDYVQAAIEKGAAGAVVESGEPESQAVLVVEDTLAALQKLGFRFEEMVTMAKGDEVKLFGVETTA